LLDVREYIDQRGRNRYREWLVSLEAAVSARLSASMLRVEHGNLAGAKSVGSGVSELRFDFGPGYRVYFGRDGDQLVLLLSGGTKKRQQADIATAHRLWAEYKFRKRRS
jgi:putative addiction module killer protein